MDDKFEQHTDPEWSNFFYIVSTRSSFQSLY